MVKFGTAVRRERPARAQTPQGAASETPPLPQSGLDGIRRWQSNGDIFWGANLTLDSLPAGLYRTRTDAAGVGMALQWRHIETDDLLELPDAPSNAVIEEIREFWKLESQFSDRGFVHKRGVLLWGPPGSGKTATLQQLISIVVKQHEGIGVFIDNPAAASVLLSMTRQIEPKRPIVALLEDLDALVETYGENEFLALLDGESQISNIVFVATTNYPERLDARFVDRPSRFDLIKFIDMPSLKARAAYLKTKEPTLSERDIEFWAGETEGFSIAHLRELIILCKCYNKSFKDAIERLNEMREQRPKSKILGPVGFRPRAVEQ